MDANIAIDKLIKILEETKLDAERHDKQQKAAGTRVRKSLQTLKSEIDTVRKGILEDQKVWATKE